MKKRFMKLYRLYRHKKFGEPFNEKGDNDNDDSDGGYDFNPQKYIPNPIKE